MVNELYRQLVHLVAGLLFASAAYVLPRSAFLWLSGMALVLFLVTLLFRRELHWLFAALEREHAAFAGKGGLFYFLGVFLTGLLFWQHTAIAILVLCLADAAATIIGTLFRSPSLPYNRRKTIGGSVTFFIVASLVLSAGYPVVHIFFIAFLLTALESFDYREIPFLDDNLVIPLVTAYLLGFL